MRTIKSEKFMTITTTADEIYLITDVKSKKINILNNTSDNIYISGDNDFDQTDGVGAYATIPPGCAINNMTSFAGVYIKALASGNITIERCA